MTSPRYIARTKDLVVQDVEKEILVYDRRNDTAHCLTAFAAAVWRRCQDGADLNELVASIETPAGNEDPEAMVLLALGELADKGLVEASGGAGVSRRQALGRMASVGLAAAAAPFVVSAAVPTAEAAGSPCVGSGGTCTDDNSPPQANNGCCAGLYCAGNLKCATCITAGNNPGGSGGCAGGTSYKCCSGACSTSNTANCA